MANHVVIQSAASLFALNIHIIDGMGVSTMFCYLPLIFLGAGLGEKLPPFSRRVLPLTEIPGSTPDFHSHVCIHLDHSGVEENPHASIWKQKALVLRFQHPHTHTHLILQLWSICLANWLQLIQLIKSAKSMIIFANNFYPPPPKKKTHTPTHLILHMWSLQHVQQINCNVLN